MKKYKHLVLVALVISLSGCSSSEIGSSPERSESVSEEQITEITEPIKDTDIDANTEDEEVISEWEDEDDMEAQDKPYWVKYSDFLGRIVNDNLNSNEEVFFRFKDSANPGYALYDIDEDNVYELFITDDMTELHKYAIYYIDKDDKVMLGLCPAGYKKGQGWIVKNDQDTIAYSFWGVDGFVRKLTIANQPNAEGEYIISEPVLDISAYEGSVADRVAQAGADDRWTVKTDTMTEEYRKKWDDEVVKEPDDVIWLKLSEETITCIKDNPDAFFDEANRVMKELFKDNKNSYYSKYSSLLDSIVSGEEYIYDAGERYKYEDAADPGYALYDIDEDGIDELFVTGNIENQWHTYTVYYINDSGVVKGESLDGYIPKERLWTQGFEYLTNAYKFEGNSGFLQVWKLDYPFDDEDIPVMITYEGEEPKAITDTELNALLSGKMKEPERIKWVKLTEGINLFDR